MLLGFSRQLLDHVSSPRSDAAMDLAVDVFGAVRELVGDTSHTNLERVELLYTSLLLQPPRRLVRVRPAYSGESVAAYRRS